MSLDDQGEAVAVAVAVAVAAGAGFSGAGTGISIVTVRAGGRGGAAPSRSPPLRPRRNPTTNPKSSPTANVANHIRTALSSLTAILAGLVLLILLPISGYPFIRALLTLRSPAA